MGPGAPPFRLVVHCSRWASLPRDSPYYRCLCGPPGLPLQPELVVWPWCILCHMHTSCSGDRGRIYPQPCSSARWGAAVSRAKLPNLQTPSSCLLQGAEVWLWRRHSGCGGPAAAQQAPDRPRQPAHPAGKDSPVCVCLRALLALK